MGIIMAVVLALSSYPPRAADNVQSDVRARRRGLLPRAPSRAGTRHGQGLPGRCAVGIDFISLATSALDTVRDKSDAIAPRPTVHEVAYLLFQSLRHVQRTGRDGGR